MECEQHFDSLVASNPAVNQAKQTYEAALTQAKTKYDTAVPKLDGAGITAALQTRDTEESAAKAAFDTVVAKYPKIKSAQDQMNTWQAEAKAEAKANPYAKFMECKQHFDSLVASDPAVNQAKQTYEAALTQAKTKYDTAVPKLDGAGITAALQTRDTEESAAKAAFDTVVAKYPEIKSAQDQMNTWQAEAEAEAERRV